ncbi:MAG: HAD-IIB family hydrolase [Bacillota bacterium]
MYFLALATDYDGTIAHHGAVDAPTIAALEAFRATGRRLILVTGRELPDLERVFPRLDLFHRVVAENGAVIHDPATHKERCIAAPPPPGFIAALKRRNVSPLSVGRVIVATWEPMEKLVLEAIRECGLELHIIFNKGAVMVLPPGINKAAGLKAALGELCLSPVNVVGVGDAENDHAFLTSCGCSAAVANALPTVKSACDIVLDAGHGAGVAQLVEMIRRDDLGILPPRRHGLVLGQDAAGEDAIIEPGRGAVLIAGSSGIGKSTLATALTERMVEKSLQFCIFDPEGDYAELEGAVCVGDAKTVPGLEESLALARKLSANVVFNTQALRVAERPSFFMRILPRLLELRAQGGRPHWLLIDEAHQLLASERVDIGQMLPERLDATIFITVHPDAMMPAALAKVESVIALGEGAADAIAGFCKPLGLEVPRVPKPGEDEVVFWRRSAGEPIVVKAARPSQARNRHVRKYAEGELGKDLSFYFRGPDNRLNLRAQNLMIFAQLADGVDDATWEHHRRHHEYSGWFRRVIKDSELADEAANAEADEHLDAGESRRRIIDAVQRRYTAPAHGTRYGS